MIRIYLGQNSFVFALVYKDKIKNKDPGVINARCYTTSFKREFGWSANYPHWSSTSSFPRYSFSYKRCDFLPIVRDSFFRKAIITRIFEFSELDLCHSTLIPGQCLEPWLLYGTENSDETSFLNFFHEAKH